MQGDSRHLLARMMFVPSAPISRIRDYALRSYPLEMLAKSIAKACKGPIRTGRTTIACDQGRFINTEKEVER